MKKINQIILFIAINLLTVCLNADVSDYLKGYADGEKASANPICLAVVPQICTAKGDLLPESERVYNGEPRCYIDVLENCYELKEKNSVSKKRFRKLKNKMRKSR